MRITVALVIACLSIGGLSAASEAQAAFKQRTNIPAQGLGPALQALAKDHNLQIVFVSEEVDSLRTSGAIGEFTAEEALGRLLKGTGLAYRFLDDRTITVQPAAGMDSPSSSSRSTGEQREGVYDNENDQASQGAAWGSFRLAQAGQETNPPSAAVEGAAASSSVNASSSREGEPSLRQIEEIIVTAQKRKERLLDIPVPVSAISGSELRDGNKLQLSDYYAQVPGLSFAGDPSGRTIASIRGLSSGVGYINPTVGFTIDDVPYGSARSDGGSYTLPEIDPGDLERMEVLRGPQGTLYGASSLGGLIKYVTVDPSFDAMKGQVSLGLNSVRNGDDPGYKAYGSINIPLADTLAVRASGFMRTNPGYVDNPVRGIKNIGEVQARGGRIATLWEPSDAFSAKLSVFYQAIDQNGALRFANPTSPYDAGRGLAGVLGDLQQDDQIGTGVRETENLGFNATLRAQFGAAELVSITGYNGTDYHDLTDDQRDYGSYTATTEDTFGPAVPNDSTQHTYDGDHDLKKFAQELRLSMPFGDRVDALFGLFYTDEDYAAKFTSRFVDPATAQEVAIEYITEVNFRYKEWAAFANFTVHFTDQFDVQFGGRRSRNEGTNQSINYGPHLSGAAAGPPTIDRTSQTSEYVSTYLVTPRYRLNDDHMVYARFSTGYRPGGFNRLNRLINEPYPPYESDSSKNYELGFKGSLLNDVMTVDASVYRIDWDDIQIQVTPPGDFFPINENGGVARSQGVELSVTARPLDGLELAGWVAINEAELARDFPAGATAAGKKGDRLPISGKVSGSFSVTQEFPLANGLTTYVGGTFTHVDDRLGNFNRPDFFTGIVPPRDLFQSYNTVDLRTGLRRDLWTVGLYVTNVADERGIIYGDRDYLVSIKPREIGLNFSRSF